MRTLRRGFWAIWFYICVTAMLVQIPLAKIGSFLFFAALAALFLHFSYLWARSGKWVFIPVFMGVTTFMINYSAHWLGSLITFLFMCSATLTAFMLLYVMLFVVFVVKNRQDLFG